MVNIITTLSKLVITTIIISLAFSCKSTYSEYDLNNFPKGCTPNEIGIRLTNRFLEQPHSQYGSPLREHEPRTQITYPDVCTWLGGLWFAKSTNDTALLNRLEKRFTPLLYEEKYLQPKPNHVDNNVFGAIALELFLQKGNDEYREIGLKYADSQWELPVDWSLDSMHVQKSNIYGDYSDAGLFLEQQKIWADKGYSWQTRVWLDDMYMITTIQAQAYLVTKKREYIDRSAYEMVLYLDSIQTSNGLFYHAPDAPFYWSRGNGWLAVGMAELLNVLPKDNAQRPVIMNAYLNMMHTLLNYQAENGMWRQLIDDKECWYESSGTAMFTYAMIIGVNNGWLDQTYAKSVRKAWLALVENIDEKGDVMNVCEGTNIGDNRQHYINRLALTGDLHGQAPVLWCANALINH